MVKKILSPKENNEAKMALSNLNYVLILCGLAIIIVGFMLMVGGGSDDPNVFNAKMFSFRRITLAPIVVVAGFAFEVFAILWRPKNSHQNAKNQEPKK